MKMILYLYWLNTCSKAYLFLRNLAHNFEDNVTKTQSYKIFNNLFLSAYKRNLGNCFIFRSNIFLRTYSQKRLYFRIQNIFAFEIFPFLFQCVEHIDIVSENYSSYQRVNLYHSVLQIHCSGVGVQATATTVIVTNGTAGRHAYAR